MKNDDLPTRSEALIFRAKAFLLQLKRGTENLKNSEIKRLSANESADYSIRLSESVTPLKTESEPGEQFLQAGKIQNLRVAAAKLNGLVVPANEIFSFWKNVGRTTRKRGFVAGREIREGCIIPNVGGGLCQISNGLYDAALKAGFEIVERHAHSRVVAGSLAEQNRDATVFWNYVDLRFKSSAGFQIRASMDAENLTVGFYSEKPAQPKKLVSISRTAKLAPDDLGSCATCGVNDCFRVVKPPKNVGEFGSTAFLVDEFVPEFDEYISAEKLGKDALLLPMDGKRFRRSNYAWNTSGFKTVKQSVGTTLIRAYRSRKLASQGAARQTNLLEMYERLAETYASRLRYDQLHLVVQQNLLPFLWRGGHLGGRTFDVLMTALPMRVLQERLDRAKDLHPNSTTLGDFRADEAIVEAETQALRHARRIVTPHSLIAGLFPEQAVKLDWKGPKTANASHKTNARKVIVFPASTVGRKGCYELREAIADLDVELLLLGPVIEASDFWSGFNANRVAPDIDWLETADLVVLPAFVEHRPSRLLLAAAKGIPVIASEACGLNGVSGITTVENTATAIRAEILKVTAID